MKYSRLYSIISKALLVILIMVISSCSKNNTKEIRFDNITVHKFVNIDNSPSSPRCKVDIQLMYAVGKDAVSRTINGIIIDKVFDMRKMTAKAAVDSFTKRYLRDYKTNFTAFYNEDKSNPDKKDMYNFYFRLKSSKQEGKDHIINYMVDESFYEGGAHDTRQTIALNFNPVTGREITIDDVFVPGYENKLNDILLGALLKKTGSKDLDELKSKGFFVATHIFAPEFILGDDEITFIYNPYEIAPYAMGRIDVKIKYSDVKDILNKTMI